MECEENNGITPETHAYINQQVMVWGFNATNHSKEHGGQGMTLFEQMLVSEQLGMSTGAIWDAVPQPSYPMCFGTKEQIEEYLIPTCQCKRRDAYAITEADAGSDPTQCLTRADKCDGDPNKATVFFVEKDAPGVSIKRTPEFTFALTVTGGLYVTFKRNKNSRFNNTFRLLRDGTGRLWSTCNKKVSSSRFNIESHK